MSAPERVTIETADGVRLAGLVYLAASDGPWTVLLHMMPATKESWAPLASALVERGVNSLAIDLRGHGESTASESGPLDYKAFTSAEHQAKILDVQAAVDWLVSYRGAARSRIALCGASIGANLALAALAADQRLLVAAALSPGLDYRGVTTEDKVMALPAGAKVWLAASDDDPESLACIRQLAAMRPACRLRELAGAGHGTSMFEAVSELIGELADWLRWALPRSAA